MQFSMNYSINITCLNLGGSKVVITADEGLRGSKKIALKNTVDKALETCESVETVLVYQRTGASVQMQSGRDVFLEEVCSANIQSA